MKIATFFVPVGQHSLPLCLYLPATSASSTSQPSLLVLYFPTYSALFRRGQKQLKPKNKLTMTMCPYKWFLYLASIWAVAYVMLEAFMQYRAANTSLQKEGYEPLPVDSEHEEDEEDEEDDDHNYVEHSTVHPTTSRAVRQRTAPAHR